MNGKLFESFKDEGKLRVFTIPNMLTMFRIVLIPVFVCFYLSKQDKAAFIVLILSGITDVADGFIARKFNMISSVGKALDPISDKLTQGAILMSLLSRFDAMWVPFLLMVFKEIFSGIWALIAIKNTGEVHGADWHGKLNTVCLYTMMALHVVWPSMPGALSNSVIGLCVLLMTMSLFLYSARSIGMVMKAKKKERKQYEQNDEMA